jgi:hypothetical protein
MAKDSCVMNVIKIKEIELVTIDLIVEVRLKVDRLITYTLK